MQTEEEVKKVAEAPTEAIEKGIETSGLDKPIPQKTLNRVAKYWKTLGPGLITGAADDDPSGVATYSQTGAQYGFQLLWLAVFSLPLMAVVQEMCARIGVVSGRGLAANIRSKFPRWVLYLCVLLLFAANAFNIGADLGAMAKATELLLPQLGFVTLVLFFTVLSLLLQIFTSYKTYARYLKYLTFVLFAYVLTGFIVHIPWGQALHHTLIPHVSFSRDQLFLICGILGTTISPYLFFWQSSQEVEEDILKGRTTLAERQGASRREIKEMRADVWSGMVVSNVVMFFIIVVCAATLFTSGITTIKTAADAASALKPLAGEWAYLFFAIGIIGTGLLAIPVLGGSSAYATAEAFRWKEGLYNKLHQAKAFYGIIVFSMIVALILNFVGIDPIKALVYSAVANGIVAPIMIVFIVIIAGDKHIMGEWVNKPSTTALGWIVTGLMALAGIAAIVALFL